MIKLIDLIESDTTPGEKKKMQNYLYRGSRDQIAQAQHANTDNILNPNHNSFTVAGSQKGVAGEGQGMLDTSNHPEDHNTSMAGNRGYPWHFDDPSGIFEDSDSFEKIQMALIGREFQTLDDLSKMASRLRQTGIAQSDIEEFILNYII